VPVLARKIFVPKPYSNITWALFASPERFFILAAALLALLYGCVVFPVTHYFHGVQRTLQVVHYSMAVMGSPGAIPASFLTVIQQSAPGKLRHHYARQAAQWNKSYDDLPNFSTGIRGSLKKQTNVQRFVSLKSIDLERQKTVTFKTKGEPLSYPVVGFLPSIIPVTLGIALSLPPVVILFMMMAGQSMVSIAFGYWIIRSIPVLKWPVTLMLLMPTYVMMRLFPMPDTLCIELVLLVLACVLRRYHNRSIIPPQTLAGLGGLCVMFSFVKLAYFPLSAMLAMLPDQCFHSRRKKWIFIIAVILLSTGVSLCWLLYVRSSNTPSVLKTIQGQGWQQIQFILLYANKFFWLFVDGLAEKKHFYTYIRSVFFWQGRIGVPVFTWWPCAGLVALGLTVFFPLSDEKTRLSLWCRCVSMAIFTLMAYFLYAGTALNPAGWSNRVQGRFILPVLPLLMLAWYNPWPSLLKKTSLLPAFFVISGCIIWLAMHYVMLRIQHII
jgi:hypothetical protein